MRKGAGVSNQLLGKSVVPIPGCGDPATADTMNQIVWNGLKPAANGVWCAIIDAVWVGSDGKLRIAVHDPFGNTKEISFEYVKLYVKE